jgi:hypothetical protein
MISMLMSTNMTRGGVFPEFFTGLAIAAKGLADGRMPTTGPLQATWRATGAGSDPWNRSRFHLIGNYASASIKGKFRSADSSRTEYAPDTLASKR